MGISPGPFLANGSRVGLFELSDSISDVDLLIKYWSGGDTIDVFVLMNSERSCNL